MNISIFKNIYLGILILGIFQINDVRADSAEPRLECDINRQSWCVLKGIGEVTFSQQKDTLWNKWTFYDSYWNRKVGVVLEGSRCSSTTADTIEVVHVFPRISWDGNLWKEVLITLKKDNTCQLKLLVPIEDINFIKKAASSLSGHVAVCLGRDSCSENILSKYIYKFFE